jgi:Protein of unknown function (DUF2934)
MKTTIKCASWISEKFPARIKVATSTIKPGRAKPGPTKSKEMKDKTIKAAGIRNLSVETKRCALNGHGHRTSTMIEGERIHRTSFEHRAADIRATEFHPNRRPAPRMIVEKVVFTIEEHLKAQQQIELRARELWRVGGCRPDTTLQDWLDAEREVLQKFIWDYARRHA